MVIQEFVTKYVSKPLEVVVVSITERDKRRQICDTCELKKISETNRIYCGALKCKCSINGITLFTHYKCPKSKW